MRNVALLLVAACMARSPAPAPAQAVSPRPQSRYNVLLIGVDDLRPVLGCYGHDIVKTPNIDRLASAGTVFRHAYCQATSCLPSRTSLLTGLRPESTGVFNNQGPHFRRSVPDCVTLPEYFKNHGCFAKELGKVFHRRDPKSWSEPKWIPQPPFAYPIYGDPGSLAVQKQQPITRKPSDWWGCDKWVKGPSWEDPDVPDGALFDGMLAEKAIEVLRGKKDEPFFLATGFFRPHLPFVAPRKYFEMYPLDTLELPENRTPPRGASPLAYHASNEPKSYTDIDAAGPISERKQLELTRAYYAAVSYVDAQIGRVLDELDRLGLRNKTVIVLWGDHGYHHGEHGMWGKNTTFEEATRTTLIASAPGIPPGATDGLVELVDIYPSLCELCGLPIPGHSEGTSFVPLMKAPTRPWKKAVFSFADPKKVAAYSMRTLRYRYVEYRKDERVVAQEVYDHKLDPDENRTVADREERNQLIAKLKYQFDAGWKGARPQ